MFKQILIIVLIIIVLIIIVYYTNNYLQRLYLYKDVIKYKLKTKNKYFLKKYSILQKIPIDYDKLLFYTDSKWSSKNINYILDIPNNYYYMIEPGYFYYLQDRNKFEIINKEIDIYAFDFEKWNNKIFVNS